MKTILLMIAVSFLVGCSSTQVASHYDGDKYNSGTKIRTSVLSW